MHRLFWKLFLSYWMVLVLFASAVVVSSSLYIDRLRAHRDSEPPYTQYSRELTEARAAAEQRGVEGLRDWLRRADSAELVPVLLLNEQGEDLLGREVSARTLDFVQRLAKRDAQPGRTRA